MKRIILAITFLLSAQYLLAQKVTFGLQGAVNMPSIGPADPQNTGASARLYPAFQFGAILDIGFKNFSFQPGLLLNGKGNRSVTDEAFISNGTPTPYNITHITTIGYVEVPLNIVYKHQTGLVSWYAGAGPYVAYALWGSYDNKSVLNTY